MFVKTYENRIRRQGRLGVGNNRFHGELDCSSFKFWTQNTRTSIVVAHNFYLCQCVNFTIKCVCF